MLKKLNTDVRMGSICVALEIFDAESLKVS